MTDLPFPSVIGLKDGCHAPCLTAAFSHGHLIATKKFFPPTVSIRDLQKGKETKSIFNNLHRSRRDRNRHFDYDIFNNKR